MENEVENLFWATKDLEEYHKLKNVMLNCIYVDKNNEFNLAQYQKYVRMMFHRYEKTIFAPPIES